MRMLVNLVASGLLLAQVVAQEADPAWEQTVTGQILALRGGDGVAALGFAGADFRTQFANDPQSFVNFVNRSGYAPIGESRTHSFGPFRETAPGAVVQEVEFVGRDGRLWEAIYHLADEDDAGWRVQGVLLRSSDGLGI